MARKLTWQSSTVGVEVELTDWIGKLGPLRTFSIAQLCDKGKPVKRWELQSTWLPCKNRRQAFNSVEEAQNAAQTVVDRFAAWVAS